MGIYIRLLAQPPICRNSTINKHWADHRENMVSSWVWDMISAGYDKCFPSSSCFRQLKMRKVPSLLWAENTGSEGVLISSELLIDLGRVYHPVSTVWVMWDVLVNGHGIGCCWFLLLRSKTGNDVSYEIQTFLLKKSSLKFILFVHSKLS